MSKSEDEKFESLMSWLDPKKLELLPESPQPQQPVIKEPSRNSEESEMYKLVARRWLELSKKLKDQDIFTPRSNDLEFYKSLLETTLRTEDLKNRDGGLKPFSEYFRNYLPYFAYTLLPKSLEFRVGLMGGSATNDIIARKLGLSRFESFTIEGLTALDSETSANVKSIFDIDSPFRPEIGITYYLDDVNKTLRGVASVPSDVQASYESLVPDPKFHYLPVAQLPNGYYFTAAAGLELLNDRLSPPEPSLG